MSKSIYRITYREDGTWSLDVHGISLLYETLEAAIRGASLAGSTDQLCGNESEIVIQQADGTIHTHSLDREAEGAAGPRSDTRAS